MELIALSCDNCGSKLKVSESAKFVTCKHCDTQLAIRHTEGAAFTELAASAARVEESAKQIHEHANEMSGQSDVLVLKNDLERLDREWERDRTELLVKGKNGHTHVPSRTQGMLLYVLAPVFLFLGLYAYSQSDNWMMLVISIGVGGAVVFAGSSTMTKAKAFEDAQSRYDLRREELVRELDATSEARKAKKLAARAEDD